MDVFTCRRGVPPGGRSSTAPLLSLRYGCVLLPLPWRWIQGFCDYGVGSDLLAALTENSLTTTGRARFIPPSASFHSLPVAAGPCGEEGDSRGTRGAGGSQEHSGQQLQTRSPACWVKPHAAAEPQAACSSFSGGLKRSSCSKHLNF